MEKIVDYSTQTGKPTVVAYRRPLSERIADALLATVIGVALAAAMVQWWSA